MELYKQIKSYRESIHLSQDDLADKVYVSRQTISNWENAKSYPDINSLIMLSNVFEITLDELVKGDLPLIRQKASIDDIHSFKKDSYIYGCLFFICILSIVPLWFFFKWYGLLVFCILYGIAVFYAFKIEKQKKNYDIQTFQEISAFFDGKTLDEISKYRESGKRPYQKWALALGAAVVTFFFAYLFAAFLKNIF